MLGIFTIVRLAGGLSFFLFGLYLLSKGLERYAGARIQALIERLTNRPAKGFVVGVAATAALQSGTLTVVTIIGLINAGLVSLYQAVGFILGAEVGTTLTVQIIAFNLGEFYLIPIIAGIVIFLATGRFKYKYLGQAAIGFGLLFMGMYMMSESMVPLMEEQAFVGALAQMSTNIPLAVAVGIFFSAIVPSSAAVIGAVIAISMAGVISLPAAIGIVLGVNVGSCFTPVIASMKASVSAKRAAAVKILTRSIGVLAFFPFVYGYASIIQLTSANMARQIANAHTVFNLVVALSFLPFSRQLVRIVKRIVPGEDLQEADVGSADMENIKKSPKLAMKYAERQLKKVLGMTMVMLKSSRDALFNSDGEIAKEVLKLEPQVDRMRYKIEDFLNELSPADFTEEQLKEKMRIFHNTLDMERVGDLADNIAIYARERKKRKVTFSEQAMGELKEMFRLAIDAYSSAANAVIKTNQVLATRAVMIEEKVDRLYWKYRSNHIKRLKRGVCDPRAEEIFTNTLRDLERISDHADNLAKSMIYQLSGFSEI